MKFILGIALALAALSGARAADLAVKAPPLASSSACLTSFCTGWYVGGGFSGNGTNADIVGNGLDNSVFAAGAIPYVNGGYQYWNGSLFAAFEAGVGDQINIATAASNETGVYAYQSIQFGGTISGIFGTSAPVTPPSGLTADLISLYGEIGIAERQFATGLQTGAGAAFAMSPHILLKIGYRYVDYGTQAAGENLVYTAINYKF